MACFDVLYVECCCNKDVNMALRCVSGIASLSSFLSLVRCVLSILFLFMSGIVVWGSSVSKITGI